MNRIFTGYASAIRQGFVVAMLLVGLLASGVAKSQQTFNAEVFTLSTIAMTNTQGSTIYYVDGISQIRDYLSAGLPPHQNAAQAIAIERWNKLGSEGKRRMQNAGVGLARAVQLGINRAPAIVFDERAVVYGVTDVGQAFQVYRGSQAYRAQRK